MAPAAVLPMFHAGLRAGVRLTEAQKREMLVTYQKTIYTALREVSDALAAHDRTREQRAEEEKLVRRCRIACGCPRCATAAAWTATCRCWMPSGTCSRAS